MKQKSHWRSNLKLLSKVSPSVFLVENLEKKDLKNLIKNHFLPSTIKLSAQKFYFFYCEKYVYGVFRAVAFRHDRTILENLTHYARPLRIWGVGKNPKMARDIFFNKRKLLALLERENLSTKKIMMTVRQREKDRGIAIAVASQMLKQLIYHFEVAAPEKLERIEKLFEEIKSVLAEDDSYHTEKDFDDLLVFGKELCHLLLSNPRLRQKMTEFNTILIYNQSHLPLATLNYHLTNEEGKQKKVFPFINLLTHHRCDEKASSFENDTKQKSNYAINSFAVVDLVEDTQSKVEVQTIKKRQQLCRRKDIAVSYLHQRGCDFENLLANNDFVHIIAHGKIENDHLCFHDDQKDIFTTKDFQSLSIMPKVLFLSVCFSDEQQFIRHFFKNGGQTMIVSDGRLLAHTLHLYLSSFYWQLFSARRCIHFAFHSMLQRLFRNKQINAFRLKLYGEGEEFFLSQKDFGEDPVL